MYRSLPNRTTVLRVLIVTLLAALLLNSPLQPARSYAAAPVQAAVPLAPADCAGTSLSTDVPQSIFDNSTVTSTLDISNGPVISQLKVVHLKITHDGASDLTVTLTDPTGASVILFAHVCDFGAQQEPERRCIPGLDPTAQCPRDWSAGTDFGLSDDSPDPMGSSCPPQVDTFYQPQEALSAFNGKLATGRWQLTVNDNDPQGTGTLDGWGLELNGSCPLATATSTSAPTHTPTRTSVPTRTHTRVPTATPTATPTPCSASFSDVNSNDFFYMPVRYLACRGIISGYTNGTFKPFNNTTRSQLAKIVVGAEGWGINTTGGPHFHDVPAINPFYKYVETAYQHGIIAGYSVARICAPDAVPCFKPFNYVTRGQTAKIVVTAESWLLANPTTPTFIDVPHSNPFYKEIETAVTHSIISGYTNHTFRWQNNATRGQISKIVYMAVTAP